MTEEATPAVANPTDHEHTRVGLKCSACGMDMPGPVQWAGGAASFAEYERYHSAEEMQEAVDDQLRLFDMLQSNIRNDPDMSVAEKAQAMQSLAVELEARVGDAAAGNLEGDKATKTEGGVEYNASDYADVSDPDKPSTWKLRLAEGGTGKFTSAQVARAITAMQAGGFRGNKVSLGAPKGAVVSKISSAIGKVPAEARDNLKQRLSRVKSLEGDPVTDDTGMMRAFKDLTGRYRWIAFHTNRYVDRAGEIFPETAHKAFVEEAYRTGQFPTLRLFHVPFDIGQTDMLDYDKGFMISSGTFLPGMEQIAEKMAARDDLGCSHGFRYRARDFHDGIYERYRSFEITALPLKHAANAMTAYIVEQEVPDMNAAQKEFLTEMAGPEVVARVERGLTAMKEYVDDHDIAYKALEDQLADERTGTKEDAVETPAATAEAPAEGQVATAAPEAQATGGPTGEAPAATEAQPPTGEVETPSTDEQEDAAKAFDQIQLMEGMKSAFGSAVATALAPMSESLEALKALVAQQGETIEGLKASRDAEIADAVRPRVGPTGVQPSSQSPANVLSETEAAGYKAAAESTDGAATPVSGYIQDLFKLAASANGAGRN